MTPIKRFMTKRIFGLAGCVIALSCYWKEFLSDLVSSDRIRILNNPIDCERLSPGVRSPDRDTPTLLLLGRLGTAKGHYDVLKALPLVVKKHPNAKVLFAGSDEEQGATERLMQLATEAGLSQNIEFLGPVLFDAKVELLRTSTLMILPSYAENMPISVLEGMAAEMPVIATRVGAIPEVFDDGRAGLLIDAGDWHALAQNVNRLLDDPVFAASLGKIAGRRARRLWDVSRTVRRIETIYREVLAA
jgi:glycosyltransferase involved in cell wall biosynthesis